MQLKSILQSTNVTEATRAGVPVLAPSDTVTAAAIAMRDTRRGSTLICENDRLVGIFTERDWLRAIEKNGDLDAPLSEAMTASPQTVTSDDSVFGAIQLMDEGGYRRVPVVDSDQKPLGVCDVKSVVHFLVEHFPAAVYNQASTEQQTAKLREGA